MLVKVGERVSVNVVYSENIGTTLPRLIKWKQQLYRIQKVGLHYTLYRGDTLIHMFSVCGEHHYFLLSFNTKTLVWCLEEIADEYSN